MKCDEVQALKGQSTIVQIWLTPSFWSRMPYHGLSAMSSRKLSRNSLAGRSIGHLKAKTEKSLAFLFPRVIIAVYLLLRAGPGQFYWLGASFLGSCA